MPSSKGHQRSLLPLGILLLIAIASASTPVMLIEAPGCSKCAGAERALKSIVAEGEEINLTTYEYYSEEGRRIIKKHDVMDVPSIIVGEEVIGYGDYNGDEERLKELIKDALENQTKTKVEASGRLPALGPWAVFVAGLLAGFNPCLLGILVFLAASVISSSGRRRDLLLMVASFSLGIFAVYFLFGLGLQQLVQPEHLEGLNFVLTALLLILGLIHIEDARRLSCGKGSLFRTDWAMRYVEAGISRGRLGSYFLIGALFSLVKAPCVGAIYLAILDLISGQRYAQGAIYLLLYNLGIILPIMLLGVLMALGMSPGQVEGFRKDYRAHIRLGTGLALLAMAPLIYFRWI